MKLHSIFLINLIILTAFELAAAQSLDIEPIRNQIVPFPHALLLPFQINGEISVDEIEFTYQSDINDAIIRGQSIYWKPGMDDIGRHVFKVTATTAGGQTASTDFTVNVRSFNAPPRFIPIRSTSIPVGIPYQFSIKAIDPDGMNKNLIRYLGVNLPKGASINEKTGLFIWEPTSRQIGENTFRVIAADQFGAASSIDVAIRVVQIPSN